MLCIEIPPQYHTVDEEVAMTFGHAVEYLFESTKPAKSFFCNHQVCIWI